MQTQEHLGEEVGEGHHQEEGVVGVYHLVREEEVEELGHHQGVGVEGEELGHQMEVEGLGEVLEHQVLGEEEEGLGEVLHHHGKGEQGVGQVLEEGLGHLDAAEEQGEGQELLPLVEVEVEVGQEEGLGHQREGLVFVWAVPLEGVPLLSELMHFLLEWAGLEWMP